MLSYTSKPSSFSLEYNAEKEKIYIPDIKLKPFDCHNMLYK